MPANSAIDTKQISGRRALHFDRIADALAEADRLEAAERAGKLRCLGNWTAGQNLGHLAAWVDYSYDGVPFTVPFIAKLFMRPMKRAILYKPMRPGGRIPKLPGGTVGFDPLPFDEAIARFRKNFSRLETDPPTRPHMLFGPLTQDEWINQHLRHAELHMSFMLV
jgi:hypothetical protein